MLNKIFTAFLPFLLLFIGSASAQEQPCGYTGKSPWLHWYQHHKQEFMQNRGGDTAWLYVPMTVHIVTGANPATYNNASDMINVFNSICTMNRHYEPHKIRFFLMPDDAFRFHFNSEWDNHNWTKGAEMIDENTLPGRLNAFLVSDPAGTCGYAWMDVIVINRSCSGMDNTTWSHEAGHHLSLPHTFLGWENKSQDWTKPAPTIVNGNEVENVVRDNCTFAGDGFCDTPADYLSSRWPCSADRKSNFSMKDPKGVVFQSDATLIMSYAHDICADRFSAEQIEAVRANLQSEHSFYAEAEHPKKGEDRALANLVSPLDTQLVQYNNVVFEWEAVPNAKYYIVEVSALQSFSTVLWRKVVENDPKVSSKPLPYFNRLLYWRVRAFNEWNVCQIQQSLKFGVFKVQNLSATNELERSLYFALSPNPAVIGQPSWFTLNSDENMTAQLTLTDAAGRVAYNQVIEISSGDNKLEIPTDILSSGIYFVNLQNQKGSIQKRLVVTE